MGGSKCFQSVRAYTNFLTLRTRAAICSRRQLFRPSTDEEFLLRLRGNGSVFIYRGPVPGQDRAGDGEHVEDEFAKVVSTVKDEKRDGKDEEEGR